MEEFIKEVKAMSTADIMLILDDQQDLYSKEELEILENELKSRPSNAIELEEQEHERLLQIQQENEERERAKAIYESKINKLKSNGVEGYWEYKVISITDDNAGGVYSSSLEYQMNALGLDGWQLVTAYSNELGKNSHSGGVGGFSTGTNSTIDQNILIFQRFIRI